MKFPIRLFNRNKTKQKIAMITCKINCILLHKNRNEYRKYLSANVITTPLHIIFRRDFANKEKKREKIEPLINH